MKKILILEIEAKEIYKGTIFDARVNKTATKNDTNRTSTSNKKVHL